MLAAQQKDFDEKGSGNYPRDFARWYQLDYFRRPRMLKTRRFYLTLAVTVLTILVCLVTVLNARLHSIHEAAPVSKAHAGFNLQCASCHDRSWQPLARLCGFAETSSVSDQACGSCHQGPIHQAAALEQPACVACHREHQGQSHLATQVADRQCTACHANLARHLIPEKTSTFHNTVTNFNVDHPEFKPSSSGKVDEAKLRFTHADHLNLDLAALRKQHPHLETKYAKTANLDCADCHQVDSQRRYMAPIKYEEHCAACHQLTVTILGDLADAKLKPLATEFRRQPAPHQEPAVVRAVLRDRFVQFAQTNKLVGIEAKADARPVPWRKPTDIDSQAWAWATSQVQANEALLFTNRQWLKANDQQFAQCNHCHMEAKSAPPRLDGLPTYAPTKIPARWYPHSVFKHDAHRMMRCDQCHDKAATSRTTPDILLPSLQLCQQCHKTGGLARNDCVECHLYHDHKLERGPRKRFKIDALMSK